ncbi:MAG: pilus assembly protein N-terminal domain-containing protein, partial [Acidobacteria bacterium]|nr:pilus assembly protein N-terminal domain-containing protein [Acidobacteriota bacterium]
MKSRRHSSATNLVGRVCTIAILLGGVPHVVLAQSLASVAAASARPVTGESRTTSEPPSNALYLLVGRSTVVDIDGAIARVSLSKPDIADALITSSQQLLVHGKAPGTISLLVWERNGALRRFEVDVQRDLTSLKEQMQRLFPGEPIAVSVSGKHIVIAGNVSSPYVIEKAAAVAAGYVDKADDVVNLLRQQQGVVSNQVLLRVRFAEVSRNALTELGASFFTGSGGYKDYVARSTTQQFSAPDFDSQKGGLVFSDFLNLLLFNTKQQIGTLVRALQNKGLFQTLAEPNLVAESGKEASFLAGGEYPYPVAQSSGSNLAIAIHFKEFGIKLNFTPTILGNDLVHLKVRPEVSSLDFGNAVSLEGFRIPALTTRRTETEIELRDGQTFAIAGLLNNTVTSSLQKIPGIGDIPVLGLLFRSKAAQKAQTELVVMITPEILRRDAAGAASGLPGLAEPFLPPPSKIIPPPMPQTPGAPRPKEPAKEESKDVGVTQPESAATPTPVIVHVPETSAAVPA